ncbi:hypothetical protein Tco_0467819 [Tanacetum coccineum]
MAAPLITLCWLILISSVLAQTILGYNFLKVINEYLTTGQGSGEILISEATIRADLLFDDENGVDCFPKQVIWDLLRDIGYEGTSWDLFGHNIASASCSLATNQSLISPDDSNWGCLGHISNGTLFLCILGFYIQRQRIVLSSHVGFHILTPSMLEVVTALAAEEEHSTSPHSRAASSARDAQGTPTQSAAHSQRTASVQGTASFHGTATPHDSDAVQGTDTLQGTAAYQGTASIPKSPNDYTPTDASQTSGGDEGLLDIYDLNRGS